jgi:hypothetical protein
MTSIIPKLKYFPHNFAFKYHLHGAISSDTKQQKRKQNGKALKRQ